MSVYRQRPAHDQRKHAGWRIAIAGAGGQGVLTAARLLCNAFVEEGHDVVSSQLRGMAQRGGSVQATVMIDCGISPVMASGAADFVLGFEPAETARAMPLMSSHTVVYMNTTPVIPFTLGQRSVLGNEEARYPDVSELAESIRMMTARVCPFDATRVAAEAGSVMTLNVVMLGCLLGAGTLRCTADGFWKITTRIMPPAFAEANRTAFFSGADLVEKSQLAGARSCG